MRYKVGRLDSTVDVIPGDIVNLEINLELDDFGNKKLIKVSEEISTFLRITHWLIFYIPQYGFGGMVGNYMLPDRVREFFINPILVKDGESLIG